VIQQTASRFKILLKFIAAASVFLVACSDADWNNPYPERESRSNILYSSFEERPKHLDPAQSY